VRARIFLGIGCLGVGYVLAGIVLWHRVVSGPGDDNPAALLGVLAAALGMVPAWGLVLWLRRRPLEAHRLWLSFALTALLALGVLTPILLVLLGFG